jgi:small nuclear ribonucleoprotein (snRNP)-like protein
MVELKSGETYNGHLVNIDSWMNIHLREVICTSKVGCGAARMHPQCILAEVTVSMRTCYHGMCLDVPPISVHSGCSAIRPDLH